MLAGEQSLRVTGLEPGGDVTIGALHSLALRGLITGAALLLPLTVEDGWSFGYPAANAQAAGGDSATSEKQAFDEAKELGTVEAWDAFLTNYPTGFRADLARAYVKKLAGPAAPPATPPSASAVVVSPAPEQPAEERSCSDVRKLKSQKSKTPAKVHFINQSAGTLIIQWIDFDGALKEYSQLQPGAEIVQETFLTHPWIAAYEEGSCRQVFLPRDGTSVARLLPEDQLSKAPSPKGTSKSSDDDDDEDRPKKKSAKPSKAAIERRAKAACVDMGMVYLNGQCAPKTKTEQKKAAKNKNKACPAGMYRNPYGQCQPNETGG